MARNIYGMPDEDHGKLGQVVSVLAEIRAGHPLTSDHYRHRLTL
jgi:hypothetical protein